MKRNGRSNIVKRPAIVSDPGIQSQIMLPAGYKFVDAADYVSVVATQQIKEGRPVIVVHVSVRAARNLVDPVFVHVEDDPVFERVQVRPVRTETITRDGFHLV